MHQRGYVPPIKTGQYGCECPLALYFTEVSLTCPPHLVCACPRQRRPFLGFQGQRRRHPKHRKWLGTSLSRSRRASSISRWLNFPTARVRERAAKTPLQVSEKATRDGRGSSPAIMWTISGVTSRKHLPRTAVSGPAAAITWCSASDMTAKMYGRGDDQTYGSVCPESILGAKESASCNAGRCGSCFYIVGLLISLNRAKNSNLTPLGACHKINNNNMKIVKSNSLRPRDLQTDPAV